MSGGGLLGSVLGAAADGFDLGDLAPLVDQLEGGLGGFGLGGLSTQILEAATGGSFGAPDLGSFGSALEGLGVNVGSLSGVDELVTSLTGGTASQLVDQLWGSGSLDEFVGGLTPGGANALIDRVTDGGGGLDSLIGRLDGGGAQALLGKLAEAGNLEQTLGQLGPDGMADLITKMVAPAGEAGDDALGALGIQTQAQGSADAAAPEADGGPADATDPLADAGVDPTVDPMAPTDRSTPRRLPTRTRCRTRRRRPSRSPRRPSRSRSTTPRPSRTSGTSSSSDPVEPRGATPMTDAGGTPVTVKSTIIELAKVLTTLGRTDLADRATAAARPAAPPQDRRVRRRRVQAGQELAGQRSARPSRCARSTTTSPPRRSRSSATASEPGAVVRRREGDGQQAAVEPVADRGARELGQRGRQPRQPEARRAGRDHRAQPVLKQGLVIVDTPGMGGLGAGHAAATLGFLPFADGLIFVSDASAELSAPEVEFLRRATELCPTVLFAQTKIDLYPHWQTHRRPQPRPPRRGRVSTSPIVAVSSTLRIEALAARTARSTTRRRVPELVKRLGDDVVEPAKANAAARSVDDAPVIVAQVARRPASRAGRARRPGATPGRRWRRSRRPRTGSSTSAAPARKWSVLVGDRIADLSNAVTSSSVARCARSAR